MRAFANESTIAKRKKSDSSCVRALREMTANCKKEKS